MKIHNFKSFINEAIGFGLFNDSQGRPNKISTEILNIVLKGLPKKITDNINYVEPNGYSLMISPPTISNKGQSTGENDYQSIFINFNSPVGSQKLTGLTIGLRKRTSGPDTGYIGIKPSFENGKSLSGQSSFAAEFYTNPEEALEKLFNDNILKYTK